MSDRSQSDSSGLREREDLAILNDRLLDVREAAQLLGLKPATLYQWAYKRRIPVVKLLGRSLRFRLTDIRRLIRQGQRPAIDPSSNG